MWRLINDFIIIITVLFIINNPTYSYLVLTEQCTYIVVVIEGFFLSRDKLLNHIERKHPGQEIPPLLLKKREAQGTPKSSKTDSQAQQNSFKTGTVPYQPVVGRFGYRQCCGVGPILIGSRSSGRRKIC